jgi:transposase
MLPIGSMDTPSITDVSALRAALVEAQFRTNIVEAELANVKAHNSDLEARNALMEFQIQKMRRELYGQSSERSIEPVLSFV